MNATIRRWTPFVLFLLLLIVFSAYFLLSAKTSNYKPTTDNPAIIYYEACSHCHGKNGQTGNLLYPDLVDEHLDAEHVTKIITEGESLMPAFKNLKGDTLQKLVDFVVQKKFR